MQTTTIDLLRHGECEGGNIYRGSTNVALSDTGWQQMQSVSERIVPSWQCIYTSPLQRCQRFAEYLAEQHHMPFTVENNLRETHFGEWEGKLIEDVWRDDYDRVVAWFKNPIKHYPPGGEPTTEFMARVQQVFDHLAEKHKDQHIGLVIHGGVIRMLIAYVMKSPFNGFSSMEVPYACISRIKVFHREEGVWPQLIFHNPLAL